MLCHFTDLILVAGQKMAMNFVMACREEKYYFELSY